MDPPYFRLTRDPFERDSRLDEACLPRTHARVLHDVLGAVRCPGAVTAVVGESGVGKSILAGVLAARISRAGNPRVVSVVARQPNLEPLVRDALGQLDPQAVDPNPMGHSLPELVRRLGVERWEGFSTVILVEDAHVLDPQALRSLERWPHAHVILLGRPEFSKHLETAPAPGAADDRVRRILRVDPLNETEAVAYLTDRFAAAGGRFGSLFSPRGTAMLVESAQGFVRRLEVLASACLARVEAAGGHEVGVEVIEEVVSRHGFDHAEALPPVPVSDHVWASEVAASFALDMPTEPFPSPGPAREVRTDVPALEISVPRRPATPPAPVRRRRAWWVGGIAATAVVTLWWGLSGREPQRSLARTDPFESVPIRALTIERSTTSPLPGPPSRGGTVFGAEPLPAPDLPPEEPGPDRSSLVTPSPVAGSWIVQAGVFRSRENATAVLEIVREQDPHAAIHLEDGLHHVLSRPFSTRADAARLAAKLERAGVATHLRPK